MLRDCVSANVASFWTDLVSRHTSPLTWVCRCERTRESRGGWCHHPFLGSSHRRPKYLPHIRSGRASLIRKVSEWIQRSATQSSYWPSPFQWYLINSLRDRYIYFTVLLSKAAWSFHRSRSEKFAGKKVRTAETLQASCHEIMIVMTHDSWSLWVIIYEAANDNVG